MLACQKIAQELFKMQMPKPCFPEVLEAGQECACLATHHGDFDVGAPESDFEKHCSDDPYIVYIDGYINYLKTKVYLKIRQPLR